MLKDRFIQEEIWKLKNIDKKELKENSVPPNLMDSPLDQKNFKDEKIIKLASGIELDEMVEAQQFMKELFDAEVKAGNIPSSMSYDEWIMSLRTTLSDGGRVIDFAKYAKSKPPKVKEIKISDYFDLGRTMASLSQSERDTLKWILNKSFPKKWTK